MRTIAMLCCLVLVVLGCYFALFEVNLAGLVLMIIGGLAFLVIAKDTDRIKEHKKTFMDK